ncbi:hypothetical protein EW026_g5697 [Hermanssonia centrifuga]|uniref:Uncharacterized protein n=1 Tax=Hermanssonia centrifuga TaxID=98765 RepID=A0A4S4KED9_9APHY|nr:hypothetical protein EW026_g5697 [Hermanssonia centrifuga]
MSDLHAYLTRLTDGSIVLRNTASEARVSFTVDELRAYHRFDALIRQYAVTQDSIVPGGYGEFQTLWNSDRQNHFQFSEYRALTEDCIIHGAPVPFDTLIPRSAQVPPQSNRTRAPELSAARQDTIQELLWESAAANVRRKEWIEKKKKERLDKKSAKRDFDRSSKNSIYGGISKAAGKKKQGQRTDFDCRSEAGRNDHRYRDDLPAFFDPPIRSPSPSSSELSRSTPRTLSLSAIAPGPSILETSNNLPLALPSDPSSSTATASGTTTNPVPTTTTTNTRHEEAHRARGPDAVEREEEDDFDLNRMFEDYT